MAGQAGSGASGGIAGSGASGGAPGGAAGVGGVGAGGVGAAGAGGSAGNGGSPGTGRYLDRCASGSSCISSQCVQDVGGTSMCSKACSAHTECASEHVCGLDGLCHPDDTGALCSTSNAASCGLGLCIGLPSGPAHCTRECLNASECPAGFACQPISGLKVCVDIERSGASCPTGLSFPTSGCTAPCTSAADCPARLGALGLPPYTCAVPGGGTSPVCIPPSDIVGSDPIGAACSATGSVSCRSGACNTGAVPSPMCTQACSEEGGCGPGLGCTPEIDGATLTLICTRAGGTALGQACSSGTQCDTGLCDSGGYCTRLCTGDALCPTDMQCQQVPGYSIALCRR